MKYKSNKYNEAVISKFKEILEECSIDYEKLFLFGSRARGNADENSDWDFLLVFRDKLSGEERREITGLLRVKFHDYFPEIPVDIIIKESSLFEREKQIINTVSNEVFTEGVEI